MKTKMIFRIMLMTATAAGLCLCKEVPEDTALDQSQADDSDAEFYAKGAATATRTPRATPSKTPSVSPDSPSPLCDVGDSFYGLKVPLDILRKKAIKDCDAGASYHPALLKACCVEADSQQCKDAKRSIEVLNWDRKRIKELKPDAGCDVWLAKAALCKPTAELNKSQLERCKAPAPEPPEPDTPTPTNNCRKYHDMMVAYQNRCCTATPVRFPWGGESRCDKAERYRQVFENGEATDSGATCEIYQTAANLHIYGSCDH